MRKEAEGGKSSYHGKDLSFYIKQGANKGKVKSGVQMQTDLTNKLIRV